MNMDQLLSQISEQKAQKSSNLTISFKILKNIQKHIKICDMTLLFHKKSPQNTLPQYGAIIQMSSLVYVSRKTIKTHLSTLTSTYISFSECTMEMQVDGLKAKIN